MTDAGRAVLDAFAAPAGPGPRPDGNGAGPKGRRRTPRHPHLLRVAVDAETLARIEKVAARKRENRSVVLRQLLADGLTYRRDTIRAR